jgi:sugar-specific transcriptional regulator TrmB
MKRSELKEAIKAEIKSVLTEEIQVGDIVTLGGDGDELEVIDKRRMFGSDMMAYRVKKVDGTKFNANVDFPEIGDETVEYSADQLRPARMMNEVYQTRSKMEQIVSLFQDMMDDEYDGQDYRKVLNCRKRR